MLHLLAFFTYLCSISCLNVDATEYNQYDFDSVEREYFLYIPGKWRSYEHPIFLPIFVGLHGTDSCAEETAGEWYLGISHLSEILGSFIAFFPEGECVHDEGKSTRKCNWNYWTDGGEFGGSLDDVGYLDSYFTYYAENPIFNNVYIDIDNIYLTGHSQGAYFTYKYARWNTLKNGVRAIAPYAGHDNYLSDKKPNNHVSVIHAHGTADTDVPLEDIDWNGSYKWDISFWLNANECPSTPTDEEITSETDMEGFVELIKYSTTSKCPDAHVRGLLFKDWPHTWPGTWNEWPMGYETKKFTSLTKNFAHLLWNQMSEMTGFECICNNGECVNGECKNCENRWTGDFCNILVSRGTSVYVSVFVIVFILCIQIQVLTG